MNLPARMADPMQMQHVHPYLMLIWAVLTLATTAWAIWVGEYLLAWLTFMSGYANVGAHWAAYQGAAPSAEGT